ncbi:MAG: B12-binding domain-containing radical SAM protein [Deltaproteobacteria bacterium]
MHLSESTIRRSAGLGKNSTPLRSSGFDHESQTVDYPAVTLSVKDEPAPVQSTATALTPTDWQVNVVDEQLEDIDFDAPIDVVALTVWTLQSKRAYDIAAEFRRRGVPVILGGPHAFFYSEEAAEHCDAIGIGEGERILPRMLADAAAGRLQKCYRAEPLPQLSGLPLPRYDLLDLRRFGPFRTFTVQSSRGCPFRCDFCSERLYLGAAYRWRPIAEVVEEIKRSGHRNVFFGESNFGGRRERAMELMEALIPLRLHWSTLWSSHLCLDHGFMDLARRSGLLHVNIGIESIDAATLATMNKRQNKADRYAEMFANLRRLDISFSVNFVFGWDTETPDVFRATLEFLHRHRVPAAYFNVLTPEKGTALFDRLEREGRVFNIEDIDRWPGQICHFKPRFCQPAELERNVQEMYRQFYSLRSIFHRLPLPISSSRIASWAINWSERRMARSAQKNNDFDWL